MEGVFSKASQWLAAPLVLLSCLVNAQTRALDTVISVGTTTPTVRQTINRLKATQSYHLAYSESYMDLDRPLNLRKTNPTVRELLDAISQATSTTYQVRGDQIIFRKKGAKFTISGYIRDAIDGEDLIGASVWHPAEGGTVSNEYGFYSLTLPAKDTLQLRVSYVGYAPQDVRLLSTTDTVVNVDLVSASALKEVTIYASGSMPAGAPTFDLPVPITDLLDAPTLLGEADVLKSLQRLPGVQAGNDGGAGLYVRGGGPDQNLILLDGVPVYNAAHLLGFFSVFNPDAVNQISFFKGGFPARYGGRLSSVVDIRLREGDRQQFHGTGSVGLLSSRLTLEGPIIKGKTSFLVSARRTYLDLFTRNIRPLREAELPTYWFYDLTAKVNHTFSHRDQVYLSAYAGQDQMPADQVNFPSVSEALQNPERYGTSSYSDEGQYWGNLTTTFRWNHVYSDVLFSNLTLTRSRYHFGIDRRSLDIETRYGGAAPQLIFTNTVRRRSSDITDRAVRIDFDYLPSPRHYVRFGGGVTWQAFRPNQTRLTADRNNRTLLDTTASWSSADALTYELFVEDDMQLSDRWDINAGVHLAHFRTDGTSFTVGQPRFQLGYRPSTRSAGHLSYSRMTQFLHLLANPSVLTFSDLWVPATAEVPPETAHQWTLGYRRTWKPSYAVQAEVYYKTMRDVLTVKDKAFFRDEATIVEDWPSLVAQGKGHSYGAELLAQKQRGQLTAWVSYALQWSRRQFDEIGQGNWFPFKYDRRHDVDVSGRFRWKENIVVSGGWGLATGFAVTLPTVAFSEPYHDRLGITASYPLDEYVVYGERNSQRVRAAHRLDLSISFRKKKRWGERTWEVSIYNVYSRRNPYSLYLERDTFRQGASYRFIQTSLFPVLPSVSYRFRF